MDVCSLRRETEDGNPGRKLRVGQDFPLGPLITARQGVYLPVVMLLVVLLLLVLVLVLNSFQA